MNLPPGSPIPPSPAWYKTIADPIVTDSERKGDSDPWNLLVFSNYPDHYAMTDDPAPIGYAAGLFGKNPPITPQHPEAITGIVDAALKFGTLPNSFEEM